MDGAWIPSPQRFNGGQGGGGERVHPPISNRVFLHPVNRAYLLDHRKGAGPPSDVYTHLNCSINPHETSSNPEKLSPDTLTARSRYTNQMDLRLESIRSIRQQSRRRLCSLAGHRSPLCSVRRHPGAGAEGTDFLSCVCLLMCHQRRGAVGLSFWM